MMLLGLLNIPFPHTIQSIFSGRYLYNITLELLRRVNPPLYCEELLGRGSPPSNLFKGYVHGTEGVHVKLCLNRQV